MCLIYLNQDEESISIDKHRQFIDNTNKRGTMPQGSEGGSVRNSDLNINLKLEQNVNGY